MITFLAHMLVKKSERDTAFNILLIYTIGADMMITLVIGGLLNKHYFHF